MFDCWFICLSKKIMTSYPISSQLYAKLVGGLVGCLGNGVGCPGDDTVDGGLFMVALHFLGWNFNCCIKINKSFFGFTGYNIVW